MEDEELIENMSSLNLVQEHLPQHIKIDWFIAKGGQGVVFHGTVNGLEAAIKIYFPGQVQTRIDREIDVLQKLNSENIVALLWAGEISIEGYDLHAVATNYISGYSLEAIIKTKKLNNREIGSLAYDLSNAIQCMWTNHIVHRDLKPQNIMIKNNGHASVIDLGVARHVNKTTLTSTGTTWGTRGYMSPEQSRFQKTLTCKSDIFALGVILIECFLGKHPTNRDQLRLFARNFHETLPDEVMSWEHANLIKMMLQPDPYRRPKPDIILEHLNEYSI